MIATGRSEWAGLTRRQRELLTAVRRAARSWDEQLMLVGVYAMRQGASQRDAQVVRDVILTGHTREAW